ncbi:phosphotransferase family protein [soil metagenome]
MNAVSAGADAVDGSRRETVVEVLARIPSFARDDVTDVVGLDGMTNRTYRVCVGGRRVIVRMPSPGADPVVDRADELANTRVAAAEGLAPAVVHADITRHLLVTAFVDGPTLRPSDIGRGDMIERVATLLAGVHRLDGTRFGGRFDVATVIDRYREHLAAVGVAIGAEDAALLRCTLRLCATLASSAATVPCHIDPWPSNIIDAGDRLVLVDWEYSAVGDPVWDLAHFVVEADLHADQTARLLRAWHGGPPSRRMRARLTLWLPVTHVVWGLWARVQHAGGNDLIDLQAYATRRLRRARQLLADDATAEALRALS